MAKFPIDRATGSLPGVSGEVTQGYSTDTGAGAVGGALRGLADTVSKVNFIAFEKQKTAQLTQFSTEAGAEAARTVLGFESNSDEDTYQGLMDQTFNKLRQKEPKNAGARRDYRIFLSNLRANYNGIVEASIIKRVQENYETAIASRKATGIQSGDLGAFIRYLEVEVSKGKMSDDDRNLHIATAQPAADKRAKEIKIDKLSAQARYLAEIEGHDAAAVWLSEPGRAKEYDVDPGDVLKLSREHRSLQAEKDLKETVEKYEAEEESRRSASDDIYNGVFTREKLNDLDVGEKERKLIWREHLQALAERAGKTTISLRDEVELEVAMLNWEIKKTPESRLAAMRVFSRVGSTIGTPQKDNARKDLFGKDPDAERSKTIVALNKARLKKFYDNYASAEAKGSKAGYITAHRADEIGRLFVSANTDYNRWMTELNALGRPITDEMHEEKMNRLMRPLEDELVKGWLDFTGTNLVFKKLARLRELGIVETSQFGAGLTTETPPETLRVLELLKEGATVEDIIDISDRSGELRELHNIKMTNLLATPEGEKFDSLDIRAAEAFFRDNPTATVENLLDKLKAEDN